MTRFRFGGAYGSLAICGALPVMSNDVYLVTMQEGGAGQRVVASKVATTGAQPMPRAYGSLVLMTSGELREMQEFPFGIIQLRCIRSRSSSLTPPSRARQVSCCYGAVAPLFAAACRTEGRSTAHGATRPPRSCSSRTAPSPLIALTQFPDLTLRRGFGLHCRPNHRRLLGPRCIPWLKQAPTIPSSSTPAALFRSSSRDATPARSQAPHFSVLCPLPRSLRGRR